MTPGKLFGDAYVPIGAMVDRTNDDGQYDKDPADTGLDSGLVSTGTSPHTWQYDADDLACGSPSCGTGEWRVWWVPYSAASAGTCDTYVPVTLEIERSNVSAASMTPSESSCASGSGDFQLVPMRRFDRDNDGESRVVYKPAMSSGTGRLTNEARITSIELIDDGGFDLRVLKTAASATFGEDDELTAPGSNAYHIFEYHSFGSNDIKGVPVFLHPPMDNEAVPTASVSMSWDCGGDPEPVSLPQGYTFRTDLLGCPGETRVTLRPHDGAISWELYGDATYELKTPIDVGGEFELHWGGVDVEGKILDVSPSTLTIDLYSAQVGPYEQCTPDTYEIPVEN